VTGPVAVLRELLELLREQEFVRLEGQGALKLIEVPTPLRRSWWLEHQLEGSLRRGTGPALEDPVVSGLMASLAGSGVVGVAGLGTFVARADNEIEVVLGETPAARAATSDVTKRLDALSESDLAAHPIWADRLGASEIEVTPYVSLADCSMIRVKARVDAATGAIPGAIAVPVQGEDWALALLARGERAAFELSSKTTRRGRVAANEAKTIRALGLGGVFPLSFACAIDTGDGRFLGKVEGKIELPGG
jgi:hypothetical protein